MLFLAVITEQEHYQHIFDLLTATAENGAVQAGVLQALVLCIFLLAGILGSLLIGTGD
jgi:hypothetical protein